jgi:hypothetical protein
MQLFAYFMASEFSLFSNMNRCFQVIVGSFLPNSVKQHQRRMSLQQQQQPSPAPPQPAPMAPPSVLTVAMPISQASPINGFHAPPPPSGAPQQAHTSADHSTTGVNLNMAAGGWPPSSVHGAREFT